MKNKVALITGASSGIGKELAKLHASKGGNLVLVARRKEKLNKLKNELEEKYGVKIKVIEKDLSDNKSALEIYNEVKKANIEVDYLINNAGFGGGGPFHERKWEEDFQMIQVNVIALTTLTKLFLPDFVKKDSGKILNVSSIASLVPGPLQAVYYATKAYIRSFSNALAYELVKTNVTVTTLMPGPTKTNFARRAQMEDTLLFSKTVDPKVVAKDAYKGMLKGQLNVISGITPLQRVLVSITLLNSKKMVLKKVYKLHKKGF